MPKGIIVILPAIRCRMKCRFVITVFRFHSIRGTEMAQKTPNKHTEEVLEEILSRNKRQGPWDYVKESCSLLLKIKGVE